MNNKGKESDWASFWIQEQNGFDAIMQMSTAVFAGRFAKYCEQKKGAHVLDFGCGPGFLLRELATKKMHLAGADINPRFVSRCRQDCPAAEVCLLPPTMADQEVELSNVFSERKFDFIVVLSVIQYFEHKEMLTSLLKMLKNVLTEKGTIVLADVVTPQTSRLNDLFCVAKRSIQTGDAVNFIKFLVYLLSSRYRVVTQQRGLQVFSDGEIARAADLVGMNCTRIPSLTIHQTRATYIVQST